MDKFEVVKKENKTMTINRTIRLHEEDFNKISELSEKSGVSFNKVIQQCITYALEHLKE